MSSYILNVNTKKNQSDLTSFSNAEKEKKNTIRSISK